MDTDSGEVNKDSGHVNNGFRDVSKVGPMLGIEPTLIVALRDRAFRVGEKQWRWTTYLDFSSR